MWIAKNITNALHDNVSYRAVDFKDFFMKLWTLTALLTTSAFASETATLELIKSTNELILVTTDVTHFSELEKNYQTGPCRVKFEISNSTSPRHYIFQRLCRAEITKFLLNKGFKAMDRWTFYK